MKKRNELAIFEDFKLKPTNKSQKLVGEKPLEKLILFCEVDKNKKPIKYWRKEKDETFVEVDEYGLYQSGSNQPKTKLHSLDTKFFVRRNKFEVPVEWFVEEKNGEYKKVKSNLSKKTSMLKEDDEWQGFEFEIKSYVRDEAIKKLSLEMKKMKKKAHEYKTEELKKLIEEKESEIIKDYGWKAIRTAALASLGLGFI